MGVRGIFPPFRSARTANGRTAFFESSYTATAMITGRRKPMGTCHHRCRCTAFFALSSLTSRPSRSNISHEVLQGKGPIIYAGELQFAKNAGLPIYLQLSEPGRGDIVNSWLPFDLFFGIVQALDLVDKTHPLDIEIFDSRGLNPLLMQLTRDPFIDPMQVLIDGISYTHQRYESVPEGYKSIPKQALSTARDLITQERESVCFKSHLLP